jgi:hypothetical protein
MIIADFSGGLNTRVAPSLLQPNEAQIYTNVDNESGSLKSVLGHIDTGVLVNKFFTYYYGGSEWVSKATEAEFVEYRDKLYISSSGDLEEYSGGASSTLGIDGPTDVVTSSDITKDFISIAASGDPLLGNLLPGSYRYRVRIFSAALNYWVEKDYTYVSPFEGNFRLGVEINLTGTTFVNYDIIRLYREIDGEFRVLEQHNWMGTPITVIDDEYNIGGNTLAPESKVNTYNYVYTYYDASTGVESVPSLPGDDISSTIGNIRINALTVSTNTDVDTIRVYRIGGDLTEYTLVKELANTASPFIDTVEDISAAGEHILDSINNHKPITGLRYITEAYAMLFAAKEDKLYYSDIAKPYAWPASNFIDFDGTVTGIGVVSNGLIVFTKYKTYIIIGNSPTTFTKYQLSGSQGCIAHNTVQFVDNSLIWASTDGICTTNGGLITVLSQAKVGKLTFLETYGSAVLDNVYYLNYYTINGGAIIAFDFRYNKIIRDLELTGNMIVSKKDGLYQHYNGTLRQLLVGSALEFHYKSPVLTEGSYSNYKIYKDIYIKYNGTFIFKVYIDGVLKNTINITGNSVYNLKADSTSKGYSIEFEITGTGEVSEIEYKLMGRQK